MPLRIYGYSTKGKAKNDNLNPSEYLQIQKVLRISVIITTRCLPESSYTNTEALNPTERSKEVPKREKSLLHKYIEKSLIRS